MYMGKEVIGDAHTARNRLRAERTTTYYKHTLTDAGEEESSDEGASWVSSANMCVCVSRCMYSQCVCGGIHISPISHLSDAHPHLFDQLHCMVMGGQQVVCASSFLSDLHARKGEGQEGGQDEGRQGRGEGMMSRQHAILLQTFHCCSQGGAKG